MQEPKKSPDYHVHVNRFYTHPWIASLLTVGLIAVWIILFRAKPVIAIITIVITLLAAWFYLSFCLILKKYTNINKRINDRTDLLDDIEIKGDEFLLDVGCGNGILILEAAKRLRSGKATGIDIWVETAGGHKAETFLKNAELAGVADKVSLQNKDVRKLSYRDESFNIIISGLTMHHLAPGASTLQSLNEIVVY